MWEKLKDYLENLPVSPNDRVGLTIKRIRQITGTTAESIEYPVEWSSNMARQKTIPAYSVVQEAGYDVAQTELELDPPEQRHRVTRVTFERIKEPT